MKTREIDCTVCGRSFETGTLRFTCSDACAAEAQKTGKPRRAYYLKAQTDLTWEEIAVELGYASGAVAYQSARRFAWAEGQPWPINNRRSA